MKRQFILQKLNYSFFKTSKRALSILYEKSKLPEWLNSSELQFADIPKGFEKYFPKRDQQSQQQQNEQPKEQPKQQQSPRQNQRPAGFEFGGFKKAGSDSGGSGSGGTGGTPKG